MSNGKWLKLTFTDGKPLFICLGIGNSFYGTHDGTQIQCDDQLIYSGVKETPEEIYTMLADEKQAAIIANLQAQINELDARTFDLRRIGG